MLINAQNHIYTNIKYSFKRAAWVLMLTNVESSLRNTVKAGKNEWIESLSVRPGTA
jgi:hypothetical protein